MHGQQNIKISQNCHFKVFDASRYGYTRWSVESKLERMNKTAVLGSSRIIHSAICMYRLSKITINLDQVTEETQNRTCS